MSEDIRGLLQTFRDYASDMAGGYLVGIDGNGYKEIGAKDLARIDAALAALSRPQPEAVRDMVERVRQWRDNQGLDTVSYRLITETIDRCAATLLESLSPQSLDTPKIEAGCYDCGFSYNDPAWIEAVVPHELWNKHLSPSSDEGGLLCINCMSKRAVAAGLSCVPVKLTAGPFVSSESLSPVAVPFQERVQPWMLACFGAEIAADKLERSDRFIEEALELVQACGYGADRAHALVDYVFGRPVGDPPQEVGGVMVTLAALCLASGLDMHECGETELARINVPETIAKIRAKQAAKPTGSALPVAVPSGDEG